MTYDGDDEVTLILIPPPSDNNVNAIHNFVFLYLNQSPVTL